MSENIKKLMEKASSELQDVEYDNALKILEEARVLLERENFIDYLNEWAFYFDQKRYMLHEKEKWDEVLSVCDEAIERIPASSLFPYLVEHNMPRATLRAAYNTKAWFAQDGAKTKKDIEKAIEYIELCFSTISPIDEKLYNNFYVTKVFVYKRAIEFDEKYKTAYILSLKDIIKQGIDKERLLEVGGILKDDILKDLYSVDVLGMELFPENETYIEAVDRYIKFFDLPLDGLVNVKASQQEIKEAQGRTKFIFGDEFLKIYTNERQINRDAFDSFQLRKIDKLENFFAFFEFMWFLSEWKEWFLSEVGSEEDFDFIKDNYVIFGSMCFYDDPIFFMYGKNGKFGAFLLYQDERYDKKYYLPMRDKHMPILRFDSVDELFSKVVTVLIKHNIGEWSIFKEGFDELMSKIN
jgi:hypothetical protein